MRRAVRVILLIGVAIASGLISFGSSASAAATRMPETVATTTANASLDKLPVTIESSTGTYRCGWDYWSCVYARNDFVRHGYNVSGIYSDRYGYYFIWWRY